MLLKDAFEATIKLVKPHSCSTESTPSLQQPLVVIDYTEEMKTVASERAYSQLSASPKVAEVYTLITQKSATDFDRFRLATSLRHTLMCLFTHEVTCGAC